MRRCVVNVDKLKVPALMALSALGIMGALAWQFGRDYPTRSEVSTQSQAVQSALAEQIRTSVAGLEVSLKELRTDWLRHDDRLREHGESLAAVKAEIRTLVRSAP